jgi:hypothetical protein
VETGGNLHNGKLQGVHRRQYYCGDQVTVDGTDETCGAHRKLLKSVEDFVGNLKKRARFVDMRAGGPPPPKKN